MRKYLVGFAGIVAALAAFARLLRPRERLDWNKVSKPGRLIEVDGERLHYIEEGSGSAVVLVHGFAGHTFSYRYVIPELARAHRTVALDLLGFGYSERPKKADYSLGAQARRVLRLMDALGIERASLVGHSMGGEVVMRAAATAPKRVDRLVLVASISGERIPLLPATPLIKPFLPLFSRLLAWRAQKRLFYDPSKLTPDIIEAYRRPLMIKGTMQAFYQMIRDFRKDKTVDYKKITQPVLIIWAAGDKILPRFTLARLKKRLPSAQVVTVERAGHLLMEERPEAVIPLLQRFLAPIEKPAPAEPVEVTGDR